MDHAEWALPLREYIAPEPLRRLSKMLGSGLPLTSALSAVKRQFKLSKSQEAAAYQLISSHVRSEGSHASIAVDLQRVAAALCAAADADVPEAGGVPRTEFAPTDSSLPASAPTLQYYVQLLARGVPTPAVRARLAADPAVSNVDAQLAAAVARAQQLAQGDDKPTQAVLRTCAAPTEATQPGSAPLEQGPDAPPAQQPHPASAAAEPGLADLSACLLDCEWAATTSDRGVQVCSLLNHVAQALAPAPDWSPATQGGIASVQQCLSFSVQLYLRALGLFAEPTLRSADAAQRAAAIIGGALCNAGAQPFVFPLTCRTAQARETALLFATGEALYWLDCSHTGAEFVLCDTARKETVHRASAIRLPRAAGAVLADPAFIAQVMSAATGALATCKLAPGASVLYDVFAPGLAAPAQWVRKDNVVRWSSVPAACGSGTGLTCLLATSIACAHFGMPEPAIQCALASVRADAMCALHTQHPAEAALAVDYACRVSDLACYRQARECMTAASISRERVRSAADVGPDRWPSPLSERTHQHLEALMSQARALRNVLQAPRESPAELLQGYTRFASAMSVLRDEPAAAASYWPAFLQACQCTGEYARACFALLPPSGASPQRATKTAAWVASRGVAAVRLLLITGAWARRGFDLPDVPQQVSSEALEAGLHSLRQLAVVVAAAANGLCLSGLDFGDMAVCCLSACAFAARILRSLAMREGALGIILAGARWSTIHYRGTSLFAASAQCLMRADSQAAWGALQDWFCSDAAQCGSSCAGVEPWHLFRFSSLGSRVREPEPTIVAGAACRLRASVQATPAAQTMTASSCARAFVSSTASDGLASRAFDAARDVALLAHCSVMPVAVAAAPRCLPLHDAPELPQQALRLDAVEPVWKAVCGQGSSEGMVFVEVAGVAVGCDASATPSPPRSAADPEYWISSLPSRANATESAVLLSGRAATFCNQLSATANERLLLAACAPTIRLQLLANWFGHAENWTALLQRSVRALLYAALHVAGAAAGAPASTYAALQAPLQRVAECCLHAQADSSVLEIAVSALQMWAYTVQRLDRMDTGSASGSRLAASRKSAWTRLCQYAHDLTSKHASSALQHSACALAVQAGCATLANMADLWRATDCSAPNDTTRLLADGQLMACHAACMAQFDAGACEHERGLRMETGLPGAGLAETFALPDAAREELRRAGCNLSGAVITQLSSPCDWQACAVQPHGLDSGQGCLCWKSGATWRVAEFLNSPHTLSVLLRRTDVDACLPAALHREHTWWMACKSPDDATQAVSMLCARYQATMSMDSVLVRRIADRAHLVPFVDVPAAARRLLLQLDSPSQTLCWRAEDASLTWAMPRLGLSGSISEASITVDQFQGCLVELAPPFCPAPGLLLCKRGSPGVVLCSLRSYATAEAQASWAPAYSAQAYLAIPVHCSGSLLQPRDLCSALYCTYTALCAHDYMAAMQFAELCQPDCAMSASELAVTRWLAAKPCAHKGYAAAAVRLQLAAGLLSSSACPDKLWDLRTDAVMYCTAAHRLPPELHLAAPALAEVLLYVAPAPSTCSPSAASNVYHQLQEGARLWPSLPQLLLAHRLHHLKLGHPGLLYEADALPAVHELMANLYLSDCALCRLPGSAWLAGSVSVPAWIEETVPSEVVDSCELVMPGCYMLSPDTTVDPCSLIRACAQQGTRAGLVTVLALLAGQASCSGWTPGQCSQLGVQLTRQLFLQHQASQGTRFWPQVHLLLLAAAGRQAQRCSTIPAIPVQDTQTAASFGGPASPFSSWLSSMLTHMSPTLGPTRCEVSARVQSSRQHVWHRAAGQRSPAPARAPAPAGAQVRLSLSSLSVALQCSVPAARDCLVHPLSCIELLGLPHSLAPGNITAARAEEAVQAATLQSAAPDAPADSDVAHIFSLSTTQSALAELRSDAAAAVGECHATQALELRGAGADSQPLPSYQQLQQAHTACAQVVHAAGQAAAAALQATASSSACPALLSNGVSQLRHAMQAAAANPASIDPCQEAVAACAWLLASTQRALACAAEELLAIAMRHARQAEASAAAAESLAAALGQVQLLLTCKRTHVVHDAFASLAFSSDVFVVNLAMIQFEASFGRLLRPQQVRMIDQLTQCAKDRRSCITQAIMGCGKTSVVTPLTGFMLADSTRLVTVTAPAHLVHMLVASFRASSWLLAPVAVQRLQFSRYSVQMSGATAEQCVARLVGRLHRLASARGCLAAAPDDLKCLLLRHVELCGEHAARGAGTPAPPVLRHLAHALALFGQERAGVLLCDEADVVLHGLRSELNFPLGSTGQLELCPERFLLPFFMAKLVMRHVMPRTAEELAAPASQSLRQAAANGQLLAGYGSLTVLDDSIVPVLRGELIPHVCEWLRQQFDAGECGLCEMRLHAEHALADSQRDEAHGAACALDEDDAVFWCSALLPQRASWETRVQPMAAPLAVVVLQFKAVSSFLACSGLSMLPDTVVLQVQTAGPTPEFITVAESRVSDTTRLTVSPPVPNVRAVRLVMRGTAKFFALARCAMFGSLQAQLQSALPAPRIHELLQSPAAPGQAVPMADVPARALKLLQLAHALLWGLLPHALSKRHRVDYGLLREEDLAQVGPATSAGRRLLAVPFQGKDSPSAASEFAQPDAALLLSCFAYLLDGLRAADGARLISHLHALNKSSTAPARGSALLRQWAACAGVQLLPLQLLRSEEQAHGELIAAALGRVPAVLEHYCCEVAFPATARGYKTKLSASGADLALPTAFGSMLGFSGTPARVGPALLGPASRHAAAEAEIAAVLHDPAVVSYSRCVDAAPTAILNRIAAQQAVDALIDAGALLQNMTARAAAEHLLEHGLPHKRGVLYVGRDGAEMVLLRGAASAIPAAAARLQPAERFTIFDHMHCTGTNIPQHATATAVVTVTRGLTLRDFSQACWRMRQLGVGQRIEALLPAAVANALPSYSRQRAAGPALLFAWLLGNEAVANAAQQLQLQLLDRRVLLRARLLSGVLRSAAGRGVPEDFAAQAGALCSAYTDAMPLAISTQQQANVPVELPAFVQGTGLSSTTRAYWQRAVDRSMRGNAASGGMLLAPHQYDATAQVTRRGSARARGLLLQWRRMWHRRLVCARGEPAAAGVAAGRGDLDAEISQQHENEQQQQVYTPVVEPLRKIWPGAPAQDRALPVDPLCAPGVTAAQRMAALGPCVRHVSAWAPAASKLDDEALAGGASTQPAPLAACDAPLYLTAELCRPAGRLSAEAQRRGDVLTDRRQRHIRVALVIDCHAVLAVSAWQADQVARWLLGAQARAGFSAGYDLQLADAHTCLPVPLGNSGCRALPERVIEMLRALDVLNGEDRPYAAQAMQSICPGLSAELISDLLYMARLGTPY